MCSPGFASKYVFVAIASIVKVFAQIPSATYEFGRDCNVHLENVNEDRPVDVTYNGEKVSCSNHFSFRIENQVNSDTYAICVTPKYFKDPDCAVELSFEYAFTANKLQFINCTSYYDSKFCASVGRDLHILFEKHEGKTPSNSKFKFLVTAKKVPYYREEHKNNFGLIGGGVGGSIFQLILCLACCRRLRRKSSEGRVLSRTPTNETSTVHQISHPPTSYPSQSTTHVVPSYLDSPSSSYHSAGDDMQHHFQFRHPADFHVLNNKDNKSAPPPSYDEVFNNKIRP
ncbi:uncharacterized protein LOC133176906 [Saccostrea echinata]|uniref:uncharacterized protein LOC133176906 n=1 Tax=Saccostrea echinata TaxID=191078 RepID=UPI002A804ABE|nr:uncharacterized protein LOC133176906 [Saccostrea echinata]